MPGPLSYLGPGSAFTPAKQPGKEVSSRCEQVHFQHMSVTPLRENPILQGSGKPRYGPPDAPLDQLSAVSPLS
jgi:hypothetical protein